MGGAGLGLRARGLSTLLRAADRVCTKKPPPKDAVPCSSGHARSRPRRRRRREFVGRRALSNGDFELASLLAEQIAARLDPPPTTVLASMACRRDDWV